MTTSISLFLKGVAMGAANVIPGVSGGTIALITGIYERLINAIKSFDTQAFVLLLKRDFRKLWQHVDGQWLSIVLSGVALSIITLARLFEYLLEQYERYTMAFFFGLILLSIIYVAKGVKQWSLVTLLSLIIGSAIAISIAFLAPASENSGSIYVFLCGVLAISSMILPGLSGSFVLILMGNYALVLAAINSFDLAILIPLGAGCVVGIVVFSHALSWVFKHFHDQTLALMTGFVVGSLVVIWPWKNAITETLTTHEATREVVVKYEWFLPSINDNSTWVAIALMLMGAIAIYLMERGATK